MYRYVRTYTQSGHTSASVNLSPIVVNSSLRLREKEEKVMIIGA